VISQLYDNRRALLAAGLLSFAWGFGLICAAKTQPAQVPSASSVAKPEALVSLDPVPRGGAFDAAVVVQILKGFHVNSHKPSEDYLIPTTITPDPPQGVKLAATTYPPGEPRKFSFSPDKPLDVYTDTVTLRLKFSVQQDAPLGPLSIPATLRYQACNDTTCLAPVKVPVVFKINVGRVGSSGHPIHPEVFSKVSSKS